MKKTNPMMQGVPAKMFAGGMSTGGKSAVRNNATMGTSSRPHELQGKIGNPKVPISVQKPAMKGQISPMAILAAPQRGGK